MTAAKQKKMHHLLLKAIKRFAGFSGCLASDADFVTLSQVFFWCVFGKLDELYVDPKMCFISFG